MWRTEERVLLGAEGPDPPASLAVWGGRRALRARATAHSRGGGRGSKRSLLGLRSLCPCLVGCGPRAHPGRRAGARSAPGPRGGADPASRPFWRTGVLCPGGRRPTGHGRRAPQTVPCPRHTLPPQARDCDAGGVLGATPSLTELPPGPCVQFRPRWGGGRSSAPGAGAQAPGSPVVGPGVGAERALARP